MERTLLNKMSIREVINQAEFAGVAFNNIEIKSTYNVKISFSSIHSFLTHCAMLSKILWSNRLKDEESGKSLAQILNIPDNLKIKSRNYRNILEHYDEYLKEWVNAKGKDINILDNNIGPKDKIKVDNSIWVRHYDPTNHTFTLIDNELNLFELYREVETIKGKAAEWLNPEVSWDDLDDEDKQAVDEERLLDELSDEYEYDPEETRERLENLGLDIGDLNLD